MDTKDRTLVRVEWDLKDAERVLYLIDLGIERDAIDPVNDAAVCDLRLQVLRAKRNTR